MYPRHSSVLYLDSGSAKQKNYDNIKSALDTALTGFAAQAGPLTQERQSNRGSLKCTHTTKFACMKQLDADNGLDGWYAILHMREFVKDQQHLLLPSSLRQRGLDMANAPSERVRDEFRHIQRQIATIIKQDVCTSGGLFFAGHARPTNADIESRYEACRDRRPFNTLEGIRPFPPKPKP